MTKHMKCAGLLHPQPIVRAKKALVLLTIFICLFSFYLHADGESLCVRKVALPIEFISPKRADLMAKYIYAKHREWKTNSCFGHDIYYRHLEVWNGFWEYDPPKRNFADYIDAFDGLLDSIKHHGFDSSFPIPVGVNGVIAMEPIG